MDFFITRRMHRMREIIQFRPLADEIVARECHADMDRDLIQFRSLVERVNADMAREHVEISRQNEKKDSVDLERPDSKRRRFN